MKDGLKYLIGKRIAGVVVATSKRAPEQQVFLIFPDGSCFEFYGKSFSCCSGLDKAAAISRYVESNKGEVESVYDEALGADPEPAPMSTGREKAQYVVAPPETLTGRMKRDLAAWRLAKAAIAKAKKPSE